MEKWNQLTSRTSLHLNPSGVDTLSSFAFNCTRGLPLQVHLCAHVQSDPRGSNDSHALHRSGLAGHAAKGSERSAGGHNVIAGLLDCLEQRFPGSQVLRLRNLTSYFWKAVCSIQAGTQRPQTVSLLLRYKDEPTAVLLSEDQLCIRQ